MSEDKAKRVNGSMLYEGPSGMLVPDANKALEMLGSGGGLYMAGAKLEREHILERADEAYQEVMKSGLTPGLTFRKYLEERCGCLSTVDSSNTGKQIGKEAKNYIMWSLTGKSGDEPRVSKSASAAALGFLEWAGTHKFVPHVTERRYFDERIGYSVEVDAVGMLDGVLTTLTVAVGAKLYDKHILKSAAAVNATNLEIGGVKQGIVLRLPKTDADFSESPFEARIIDADNSKRDLGAFVNALGCWQWASGYERTYADKKLSRLKKAAAG